jgi:hypothetical protein
MNKKSWRLGRLELERRGGCVSVSWHCAGRLGGGGVVVALKKKLQVVVQQ